MTNLDGYEIFELENPVNFTAYIEPAWIPDKEHEVIKLNKVLTKVRNVEIVLENVMHRGNDI